MNATSVEPGELPLDVVQVRHGETYANKVQRGEVPAPEDFYERPDLGMPLSARGVAQVEHAGVWLRQEFPGGFADYRTSTYKRGIQTAGRLALGGQWIVDDRLRKRDWGEFGRMTPEEREREFPWAAAARRADKWRHRPPGGENEATDIRLRHKSVLDTWRYELHPITALLVAHGEFMDVSRVVLEGLLPSAWLEQQKAGQYEVQNCQIVHYSRRDPGSGEIDGRLNWRRSVCPWDDTLSWDEGEWVEIPQRLYTDAELLKLAE